MELETTLSEDLKKTNQAVNLVFMSFFNWTY